MKKFLAFILLWIYAISSNTLVHSFCLQEIVDWVTREEVTSDWWYWCCDWWESDENCYDNCLSDITLTVQPVNVDYDIYDYCIPKSAVTYEYEIKDIEQWISANDPPDDTPQRTETYIGITKKLE
jgi:hypothetical protein